MKRSISIFGATGSVGDQTLDIVRRYKDSWQVDVLTAKKSVKKLSDAAKEFSWEEFMTLRTCLPTTAITTTSERKSSV